ncbi:DUF5333 domain-containing protein [Rhodovulum tesquicola]|uniref:DUF5333 domain-containing protein n=1 Tax=Rhodovulum tesquicola TaxID=540254 RepID=UPI0020973518|nr:DUF5333 domain-containing protein [Rhodovulum tesquicola]MCO8145467.1 DUF5333 domain-containing protein [Rhodovulum tesquicola]
MRLILSAALALVMAATTVQAAEARPPLREHAEVNRGLTVIAIADMIRKNCDSIEPRMVRAYGFMRSLKNLASAAGYSDREIENYVSDKAEKKRIEDAARAWLVARGVRPGEAASYCPVGLAEIARNSQVGVLLRAR